MMSTLSTLVNPDNSFGYFRKLLVVYQHYDMAIHVFADDVIHFS